MLETGITLAQAAELKAVDLWHHRIRNNNVRFFRECHLHRFGAVCRTLNRKPGILQDQFQHAAAQLIIIYRQNFNHDCFPTKTFFPLLPG